MYVTRRVSYKKEELFILQELLGSFPVFGWVRVVQTPGMNPGVPEG
jgi:hypothetical protein